MERLSIIKNAIFKKRKNKSILGNPKKGLYPALKCILFSLQILDFIFNYKQKSPLVRGTKTITLS